MRFRIYLAFLFVLISSIDTALGGDHIKTKSITEGAKNILPKAVLKDKSDNFRSKRSLDGEDIPFWPNRGRRVVILDDKLKLRSDVRKNEKDSNDDVTDKEPPFWGTRGRRDGSIENDIEDGSVIGNDALFYGVKCKQCYNSGQLKESNANNQYLKDRREEQAFPFWGNRGRRNSGELDDANYYNWKTRYTRQEEDPFWGARGRRDDEVPFWGNRGRRYSWGKDDVVENPPFWGNRGRRDEMEPFWGSRGRRQESESFWGGRGIKENQNQRIETLKKVLHDAVNAVEDNILSLSRTKRDGNQVPNSFWGTRGRDSKLSDLFTLGRHRFQIQRLLEKGNQPLSNTIQDDRMYADQPRYILVERSSRSSSEDDPYYITRGKKMFISYDYPYSTRSRRGSIEEIVKSVRNDPYYIARGKKYSADNLTGNTTVSSKDLAKGKELICSTIDLLLNSKGPKTKRELGDNDRDRRTTLKKLAAQLQMDPYFVSRGKRNASDNNMNEDDLEDFVKEISLKCN